MLKAIIIEDEIGSVNVIIQLLAANPYTPIQVIGIADTIEEGYQMIDTQKPDVVFMDIEIKDGTSFSILERLDQIDFKLIFITAFDKFAIDAFKFSAIDYLLKPIENAVFYESLKKLSNPISPDQLQDQFQFLKGIREHNVIEKVDKIALIENKEIHFVPLDHIVFLKAEENYTEIYTQSGKKYLMAKNLGHYSELLSHHSRFFRIHYSTIIHMDYIDKLVKSDAKNQYEIHLRDGKIFEISRRRVAEFRKIYYDS